MSSIKYVFLELTNHCNFNCTFCPNECMTRSRGFMDKELALRIVEEIYEKRLTDEPLQLHLMGEPLLYPHLFDVVRAIRRKNFPVRLFTNGALLNERNRDRIYEAGIEELTIGIHTFTEALYDDHRRGKLPFDTYMKRIRDTIEEKFRRNSGIRVYLHYLNTKHFNRSRTDKNYPSATIPLVDSHDKAVRIVEEWKSFGRRVAEKYRLSFEPRDLECLQGPFKDAPLDCLKGDHCEILPGVILGFKDISSFSDYLTRKVRYVERFKSGCPSFSEQLAVLWDGRCTPCCVDYDGRLAVGDANSESLESVWSSRKLREYREQAGNGALPESLCRVCKAYIVVDDYEKKFPAGELEDYDLVAGWYPLEHDGQASCRWTGKKADLEIGTGGRVLEIEARNAHPLFKNLTLTVHQGGHEKVYVLQGRSWQRLAFELKDIGSEGRRVSLESERFWIPAEIDQNNQDRRELGVMVKSIRLRKDVFSNAAGPAKTSLVA